MEQALENLDVLDQITPEEQETAELLQAVEADDQKTEQETAADLAAQQGAAFAVSMAETFLKMRWSFVQVDDAVKEQVAEKAVPVFRKYGGELPDWLQPYKEEIELGMVVAVAGLGIVSQVKAHQAQPETTEQRTEHEPEASQPEYATL